MEHKSLLINHRLESWVYADAAARASATGFFSGDVGRVSFQTDTGQHWRLTDDSPVTWALIGPPTAVASSVYASLQTAVLSPTALAGAVTKMAGLGSTAFLTPNATGKVRVAITVGAFFCSGGAFYSQISLVYGSGTAPINGATSSFGTAIGSVAQSPIGPSTSTVASLEGIITALTVGTQYWFDLAAISSNAGGTANMGSVTVAAAELP